MASTLPGSARHPDEGPGAAGGRTRQGGSLESRSWDGRCASHCCPTGASRTAVARASTSGRCPASWPSSGTAWRCSAASPTPCSTPACRSRSCPAWTSTGSPTRSGCPGPSEFRDWIDVAEWATMCAAGFPEPLTFTPARRPAPAPPRRRVRRRPRQPVARLRAAPADEGRAAHRRDRAPPHRHRPRARAGRRPLAAQEADAAPLVRLHPHAGEGRAAPGRRHHGVGDLAASTSSATWGCRRPASTSSPTASTPAPSRPPPEGQRRDTDSILVVTSADVPLKGLVHLLEALAKLRTERPVTLTVVGSARPGGPAETTRDRLGLQDAVRFTGPVPEEELIGLMQRATVVAIPSLYEGFSLPAIEAMACGAPLVTTDAGALPEVVGTKAGLRVKAGDVGELTAALQAGARVAVAGRAAGPRRPAPGPGELHLAGHRRAHRRLVRADPGTEGTSLLTVDYDLLDLRPGMRVLDLGCGEGRHAFEAYRRGADVVAVDWGVSEVGTTKRWLGAIGEAGEAGRGPTARRPLRGGPRRPAAPALPRCQRRPGHGLGGARAHPGRRHRDGRDLPRAQARRPDGRSPCRATARSGSAGPCRTSTTPTRAGTSASTVAASCATGWPRSGWCPAPRTTRTPCTRPSGGSSARSAWRRTTPRSAPTTGCWSGTSCTGRG